MRKIWFYSLSLALFYSFSFFSACKHASLTPMEDIVPADSTNNEQIVDTLSTKIVNTNTTETDSMNVNTTDTDSTDINTTDPNNDMGVNSDATQNEDCDPETIDFNAQVLPILKNNCAISGCHDVISAKDKVILETFESVINTADVRPFDLDGSDLYEVITDEKEEDRMPPAPRARLTPSQIEIIGLWIDQGAQNLSCNELTNNEGVDTTNTEVGMSDCNTTEVSFMQIVMPVMEDHCAGCHGLMNPSAGITLTTYAGVKSVADNGRLIGAISWENGFKPMPQGGDPLPACTVDQLQAWVDQGAQDN